MDRWSKPGEAEHHQDIYDGGQLIGCQCSLYGGDLQVGEIPLPQFGLEAELINKALALRLKHLQEIVPKAPPAPKPQTVEQLRWRKRVQERLANSPIICREVFGVEWEAATSEQKSWSTRLHKQIEYRAYENDPYPQFFFPCDFLPKVSEDDGDSSQEGRAAAGQGQGGVDRPERSRQDIQRSKAG